MADDLQDSTKHGKKRTTKTSKLTQGEVLQIFQQAVLDCQTSGIEVQIMEKFYADGCQYWAVLMANVEMVNGNLVLITDKEE